VRQTRHMFQNPRLYIEFRTITEHTSDCGCPIHHKRTIPIRTATVPRMTEGPVTGASGWNDAISTTEAQQWVRAHGVCLSDIRTIGFTNNRDETFHCMGFYKH
jgi:hypothetical protein